MKRISKKVPRCPKCGYKIYQDEGKKWKHSRNQSDICPIQPYDVRRT